MSEYSHSHCKCIQCSTLRSANKLISKRIASMRGQLQDKLRRLLNIVDMLPMSCSDLIQCIKIFIVTSNVADVASSTQHPTSAWLMASNLAGVALNTTGMPCSSSFTSTRVDHGGQYKKAFHCRYCKRDNCGTPLFGQHQLSIWHYENYKDEFIHASKDFMTQIQGNQ